MKESRILDLIYESLQSSDINIWKYAWLTMKSHIAPEFEPYHLESLVFEWVSRKDCKQLIGLKLLGLLTKSHDYIHLYKYLIDQYKESLEELDSCIDLIE
jgi:hypothetical protein